MNHNEWQALLLKYRKGKCTKEEILKIHLWYEGLNADVLAGLEDREREEIENRILHNLRSETADIEYAEPFTPEMVAEGDGACRSRGERC